MQSALTLATTAVLATGGLTFAATVATPFAEDFTGDTVDVTSAGTTANTTDFTFTTGTSAGGFNVVGEVLQLRENAGAAAGGNVYTSAAAVTADVVNAGFSISSSVFFPGDGLYSNAETSLYLVAGGDDLTSNAGGANQDLANVGGYALGIVNPTNTNDFGDPGADLVLVANGVELGRATINAEGGSTGDSDIGDFIQLDLELVLTGTPDGAGGIDLTGTLTEVGTTNSLSVSGNVGAADLAGGSEAGYRAFTDGNNNDYGVDLDNFNLEITPIPEPGAAGAAAIGLALLAGRRR